MKLETWGDSAGCYAAITSEESIYIVNSEYFNCLTMYLKADDDDLDYMPENMVFSLEKEQLSDMGKTIYDILSKRLRKDFGDSYIFN